MGCYTMGGQHRPGVLSGFMEQTGPQILKQEWRQIRKKISFVAISGLQRVLWG